MAKKYDCILIDKNRNKVVGRFGTIWQTIFTESEIAEMDITGFKKIEVTE